MAINDDDDDDDDDLGDDDANGTEDNGIIFLPIRIKLTKSVDSFSDLLSIAAGMMEIDSLTTLAIMGGHVWVLPLEEPFVRHPAEEFFYVGEHAQIREIHISSPPIIDLNVIGTWIGVAIAIIAGSWGMIATYPQFKQGLEAIRADVKKWVDESIGIPEKFKGVVKQSSYKFLDGLLELPEREATIVLRKIHSARNKLAIRMNQDTLPTITIDGRSEKSQD